MKTLNVFNSTTSANTVRIAYLVEERANPSTDFFVLPALIANGCQVIHCDFTEVPNAADLQDAIVVFVRYVPTAWAQLVETVRSQLRALIFFMDDDVLDVKASVGMPWKYRFKLVRQATWRLTWLQQQKANLWVSTAYLHNKYATWQPKLVLPSPVDAVSQVCRVFYHGSAATHKAEIRWLHSIMEQALQQEESLAFEIIGGNDVQNLYRSLPRVTVIHTLRWPAYQQFLGMCDRHIGLAPLLDVPFNQARSYTKFFDFTRCGAVGIYSPNNIFTDVIEHGVDGLIVELNEHAWVEAILNLARDASLRQTLQYNATLKSAALTNTAQQSYTNLL